MAGLLRPLPNTSKFYISQPFDGIKASDGGYLSPGKWAATGLNNPVSGYTKYDKLHRAVDFNAPIGSPVYAPERMIIRIVGYDKNIRGIWYRAEIRQGTIMDFLHLSRIIAEPGEIVQRGQIFALTGSTGNVLPHLHWALYHTGIVSADDYRVCQQWAYRYNPEMALEGGSRADTEWLKPGPFADE